MGEFSGDRYGVVVVIVLGKVELFERLVLDS